jgi:nucleotide-binding universal stress UspA family protein
VGYSASTPMGVHEESPMKILVAVDGSRYTKRMLAYLAAHDEWLGAHHRYTVLTVVGPLPERATSVLDKKIVQSHYVEEAEQIFKPIRAFCAKQGVDAEFVSKVGAAGEVIADKAREGKYDLLIMGSHGQGALAKLLLGSVTSRVLANCEVPLLIVR